MQFFLKRCMDIAVAAGLLLALAPVLVVVAWLVHKKLGTPIFFRQQRIGYKNQPFDLIKFRTMTDERDEAGNLMPDDVRLTPFGQFLRSTSLDELPELWNILTGRMSLVGPRPLLPEYLPFYTEEEQLRVTQDEDVIGNIKRDMIAMISLVSTKVVLIGEGGAIDQDHDEAVTALQDFFGDLIFSTDIDRRNLLLVNIAISLSLIMNFLQPKWNFDWGWV